MKALAIISGVSLVIISVLSLVMVILRNKIKRLEADIDAAMNANKSLSEALDKMSAADEIKQKNRSEANEKLKSLDGGDSVNNALDVLRNNKG